MASRSSRQPEMIWEPPGLAISYEKLGETHAALGNLNKALEFFEIETTLFEELYESYWVLFVQLK